MGSATEFPISLGMLLISAALLIQLPLSLSLPEKPRNRPEQQRILYGYNVRITNLPFVAALYFSTDEYPFCSGTVLAKRWILTTANCIMDQPRIRLTQPHTHQSAAGKPQDRPFGRYNASIYKVSVVVGTQFFINLAVDYTNISLVKPAVHKVTRAYMPIYKDLEHFFHQDMNIRSNLKYRSPTDWTEMYYLNMALLQLRRPIVFNDYVKPIPIFSSSIQRSHKLWYKRISEEYSMRGLRLPPCIATGFGFDPNGFEPPPPRTARYTRMMHVDHKHCAAAICANNSLIPKVSITPRIDSCFASVYLGETCPADEGAPVYCNWFRRSVVGIITTSSYCGRYGMPTITQRLWAGYRFFKRVLRNEWPLPQMPDPVGEIIDVRHGIQLPLK